MDFANFDDVAETRATEITFDVLTRVERNAGLVTLLRQAALLGFVAGCQHGAQVGASLFHIPESAPH